MVTNDIAYAEVFDLLSYMKKDIVMKIPLYVLEHIKNNRNTKYISKIDPNNIFNKDNISYEARRILAWLDYEYLVKEESKTEKMKLYQKNEMKYQEKLKEKYNSDNIFKSRSIETKNLTTQETLQENLEVIVYTKNKWYKNIFRKILDFIKWNK